MRRVDLRRRMTRLVRQWSAGGETQAAFAARHGLSATKLRYWLRHAASRSNDSVGFAPVQVIRSDRESDGVIEIVLSTGERVLVPPGVSPDFLRQILTALR